MREWMVNAQDDDDDYYESVYEKGMKEVPRVCMWTTFLQLFFGLLKNIRN